MRMMTGVQDKVGFIWLVANGLRRDDNVADGHAMLPLAVRQRLDGVLPPTRQRVRDAASSAVV